MRTMLSILFAATLTTSAMAATFTVNSTDDANDGNCDATHCSLREAINAANAAPGADLITFAIGSGPQEIAVTTAGSPLTVTDSVTIDGTTQPGFSSSPIITLRGVPSVQAGLHLNGGSQSTTVRGLAVLDFATSGIQVNGTVGSIVLENNDVSTPPTSVTASRGIYVDADVTGLVLRGNVVRSSGDHGIHLQRVAGGTGLIENNILGLQSDGMTPDGNGGRGLQMTTNVTTPLTIRGNVISSNVEDGMVIATSGHIVEGNLIGVAADGSTSRPNGGAGIFVSVDAVAMIGGADPAQRNIVSNNLYGIFLDMSARATVQGNTITDNLRAGIYTRSNRGALIGGSAAEGNLIASNGEAGVMVEWDLSAATSAGSRIEGNSIHSNGGLGIDLAPGGGVTPNDSGDADTDVGNRGQNFPVITSAVSSGSSITVNGTLHSEALQSFRVCVYGNSAVDPSSHGEGETFLGCTVTNTDAAGNATFSLVTGAPSSVMSVSATATALTGSSIDSTSEFSAAVAASAAGELQFTAASYSVAENGGSAAIVVERTGGSGGTVTASFTTANGSAIAGQDYTGTNVTVTFTDGDTAPKTVLVPILNDAVNEASESFTVTLSNPTGGASIGSRSMAVVTITDDDPLPQLSIGDATVSEGNSGGVSATFTVTLTGSTAQQVTVSYATANVSAVAPADYTASSGTLVFAPGTTTQTVTVTVNGDLSVETSETFQVNLSSPVNATVADGQGIGTIVDDDAAPTVSINDITVAEGATAIFTVNLSNASGATVTVDYATGDGTAVAGQDYVAASGQLTFAPGDTTKSVAIAVADDSVAEPSETFVVNLSGVVNATLADGQGEATVTDNDATPTVSISDASAVEDSAGAGMVFTVTLSNPSSSDVSVAWSTADGTATSGSDYIAASGQTLTIPAGATSGTVSVALVADAVAEGNEDFFVNLTAPVNAVIADAQGRGTVIDDDGTPALTIGDATAAEASGTIEFTVTLAPSSSQTVTVQYQTANGNASAGADYAAASGTLTFSPGQTSQTIAVTLVDDSLAESAETFTVDLSAAVNATIARAEATGTIVDDDGAPALTISDATASEGSGAMGFTVTLAPASAQTVTVAYATADGTATAGIDYSAASGTLTFAPGQTAQVISVAMTNDTLSESAETFVVNLSAAVNATIARPQATGTIIDDDPTSAPPTAAPSISINDAAVAEGNNGSTQAIFNVSLSSASTSTVTVDYATANGTALAGSDYVASSGTLTFLPGSTQQSIPISIIGDIIVEPSETFTVALSNATNATIADGSGTGTVVNDDVAMPPPPPPPAPQPVVLPDVTVDPSVRVTECTDGSGVDAVFTIRVARPDGNAVSVTFRTVDGTAVAGRDYEARNTLVTIPAWTESTTVAVRVLCDDLDEADETFFAVLSDPVNANLRSAMATGTIADDDLAQRERHTIAAVVGSGPGAAGSRFRSSVRLFNASDHPITGMLVYHPAGRTASDDDPSLMYALQPGQSRFFADVLESLGASGLGTLDIIALDGELPVASIRIYNDAGPEGTAGFAQDDQVPSSALHPGERGALFVPADLTAFRFNIGVRTLEEGADLGIEVRSESGEVRFSGARALPANYFAQTSGDEFVGTALQEGDTIVITVRSGALIAYGATVDNLTNDPSAQFLRKIR